MAFHRERLDKNITPTILFIVIARFTLDTDNYQNRLTQFAHPRFLVFAKFEIGCRELINWKTDAVDSKINILNNYIHLCQSEMQKVTGNQRENKREREGGSNGVCVFRDDFMFVTVKEAAVRNKNKINIFHSVQNTFSAWICMPNRSRYFLPNLNPHTFKCFYMLSLSLYSFLKHNCRSAQIITVVLFVFCCCVCVCLVFVALLFSAFSNANPARPCASFFEY